MALITCPKCKIKLDDTVGKCPNCGYKITWETLDRLKKEKEEQQAQKGRGKGHRLSYLLAIAIFFALCFLLSFPPFSSLLDSPSSNKSSTSSSREVVKNSGWDGSVYKVKSYLKANLKDPGSIEFIEWSPVQEAIGSGYMVRAKYRAKNSFGGYVVENKVFHLNSSGDVIGVNDY